MDTYKREIREVFMGIDTFKQCGFCGEPVPQEHESCTKCESKYFVPEDKKDFTIEEDPIINLLL